MGKFKMIQSIKDIISQYGVSGDILLYRDADHRKKKMTEYVVAHCDIPEGKEVCTYSDGAFGLYLSRALPQHTVHTYFYIISSDYGELMRGRKNLVLHPRNRKADYDKIIQNTDYYNIDQYRNPLVLEYYKEYFPKVVQEIGDMHIDAFCDTSHSGATLGGFIAANKEQHLVDWDFINGIREFSAIEYEQRCLMHSTSKKFLVDHIDVLQYGNYLAFDTYKIGCEIETKYAGFGNVYEATRSIAAAMDWLTNNPGKTVLVYVGDSFEKEGTQFR